MLDRKLSRSQSILLYIIVVVVGYAMIKNGTDMLSSFIPHALE